MNHSRKLLSGIGMLAIAGLIAWPVYAHCGKCAGSAADMVKRMQQGNVDLSKAIDLAQKECGGKALAALPEMEQQNLEMEVYCLKGEQIVAVTVDVNSGKVMGTKERKFLPVAKEHKE